TEREQQQYLVGIASDFQTLVRAALNADYSAHSVFNRNELRLITAIVNTTEQFNTDFVNIARTYLFESETQFAAMVPLDAFDVPDSKAFPDLERIIVSDWSIDLPQKGIMKWIKTIHQSSRGLDLGSLGHGVLPSVFREQSAKWEMIAKQYLSKIILFVHRFILKALEVVCADTQVLQLVSSAIIVELCAKYKDGMNQATFLVNVERQLKPYTLNHYFNHNQQR
ncbi:hypothetical protein PtrSN001C_012268, partial [Pyrenophora tritici-repentis]